ncbi:hypothetical protein [Nocardioides zhouii]|uniref:YfhO family protein n=1 Tax=Nocardioides zhouii TaxID=1168729 RepID=A0A4Q2T1P5_9ACTN|nr:hypothetical protein [Nocardioides zhouii]RYC10850.1 hypothetical protein EUA94_11630 [Nocardioides zhouii]
MQDRTWGAAARWLPTCWALVLAVLMLGGALGRGFVLTYDMVWVPDLSLGLDALGLGTALPRAVPSDAVVAVLDEVVPGEVLQKLVLLGALVSAGSGAAALCGRGTVARLVAATVFVWNPFVVERLAIGHWPVLVGYGVLPWVLLAGATWRRTGWLPARLAVLLLVGSLSATTGLVTAVAVVAAAAERSRRRWVGLAVLVGAANAPWVASGLLHAGEATSSAVGADVFAPSSREGLLPAPLHFLTLGGVWNAESVPGSRTGVLAVGLTILLVLLAAVALRRGWSSVPVLLRTPLLVCWSVGMVLVVATWALPDATGRLAGTVPGGGLLRDGARMLALAAPLTAVLAGRGADAVVRVFPDTASRTMVALGCVLAPVALMPDAALGLSGRLAAVDYTASYEGAVEALATLPPGDVVLLPFQSYRAPSWNGGRPVLDPLGRYLGRHVVVEDQLVVDGETLAGEDPRAAEVRDGLAAPTPEARAEALRAAGVRLVVVEDVDRVEVPEVAGDTVGEYGELRVVDVGPGAAPPQPTGAWVTAMAVAWAAWASLLLVGMVRLRRARRSNFAQ